MCNKKQKKARLIEAEILASLRHFRKIGKVTQAQLAQLTGIDQPTLSSIENGKRRFTVQHLLKISEALKVNMETIIDRSESRKVRGTR